MGERGPIAEEKNYVIVLSKPILLSWSFSWEQVKLKNRTLQFEEEPLLVIPKNHNMETIKSISNTKMLKSSNFTSRFYSWSPSNSQSDVPTPRNSSKPPYKWLVPFSNWPPKPPNLKNFEDPHPQIPQEASPAFHRLIPYPFLQSKRPRWNQTVTSRAAQSKG